MICGSEVPISVVEKILLDYSNNNVEAKILSHESEIISTGVGFTSQVIRSKLTWDRPDQDLQSIVIIKAPQATYFQKMIDTMMSGGIDVNQLGAQVVPIIHGMECAAYKVLNSIQKPPIPIPRIYGMRQEPPLVIVMEDMSPKGGFVDIIDGITLQHWNQVVDSLADLHAWSLNTNIPWRDHITDSKTALNLMSMFIQKTNESIKIVKETFPTHFGHLDEDLYAKAASFDRMFQTYDRYLKIMPVVMLHGDTYANNIFFDKNPETGEIGHKIVAFIDWQICFAGCGLSDLSRFNALCVNLDLKKEYEIEMVQRYFDRFMSKSGFKSDPPLTFETVWEIYEEMTALNDLMCVAMALFVTKNFCKEPGSFEKILHNLKTGYDKAAAYFKDKL